VTADRGGIVSGDPDLTGVTVVGDVLEGVVESGERVGPVWPGDVTGDGRGVEGVVKGAGDGDTGVGAVWAWTERGYHATTAKLVSARQLV
jgi:hypothetical protein